MEGGTHLEGKKLAIHKAIAAETVYWGDGITVNITCPECGFEYAHFESSKVIPGNDNYDAGWGGRGDLLVIPIQMGKIRQRIRYRTIRVEAPEEGLVFISRKWTNLGVAPIRHR